MKSRKLWAGLSVIMLVFTVVFGLILTSCDEPIAEDDILGDWYKNLSDSKPSFTFVEGSKVTVGSETFTYASAGGSNYEFKTQSGGTRGRASLKLTPPDNKELTVGIGGPIPNGKYYKQGYGGSTGDTVEAPVASPAGGIYTETQTVTLTCKTTGVKIYYTTNGSFATPDSDEYSTPITISADTTLMAVAVKSGAFSSDLVENYTITSGTTKTVTTNTNAGDGSLRDALDKADDGDKIIFNAPMTIDLTACLVIRKSVIIEGKGVVLQRNNAGWTDNNGSLLQVNENKTVNISGIHFKEGKEIKFGYGGAIYNVGTLSLESCIFSGNNAVFGGAIFSSSQSISTTLKGCTFYNNSATSSGGAIYVNGGSLYLTGNIFYQNTAPEWKVVDYGSAAKKYTRGYNVVDVADGPGKTQCGWEFHEKDKLLSTISGISGAPFNTTTFVPQAALKNFITTPLDGFPTKDFNGADRSSGVPGAVNAAN